MFYIFYVYNICGNHLYQRKTLAQTGDPLICLLFGRRRHHQTVTAALRFFQIKINLFLLASRRKKLAEYIGRKILLYKIAERILVIGNPAHCILNLITPVNTNPKHFQNFH